MIILPANYSRIKVVTSFDELVNTPFANGINALCWERTLMGDFNEVVGQFVIGKGITNLDPTILQALSLSVVGKAAVDILIEDQRKLRALDLDPALDCVHGYLRDENSSPVSTDVYSFHVDSATAESETYLCTYYGLASQGLRNDEARRRVDIPETRAELLREFGGEDGNDFREYLHENCYDLHFAALAGAKPFSFGIGNLWRIAVEYPGSPVPACIHRAPETGAKDSPRLLLIC